MKKFANTLSTLDFVKQAQMSPAALQRMAKYEAGKAKPAAPAVTGTTKGSLKSVQLKPVQLRNKQLGIKPSSSGLFQKIKDLGK